jgi:hypothetical protein
MASDFTDKTTIDGKEYQFELLSLADALEVESKVASLIAQTMGKGEKDHKLLYQIGKKVCAGLCVDDFEIKDIDEAFRGKPLLFNKVMIAGVKANFPDFFTLLAGNEDSAIMEAVKQSGLASVV